MNMFVPREKKKSNKIVIERKGRIPRVKMSKEELDANLKALKSCGRVYENKKRKHELSDKGYYDGSFFMH